MIERSASSPVAPHERAAREFWILAISQKWVVLGLIALSNIVAFALYSVADPVYEARVGIVVGRAYIDDRIRGIEGGKDVLLRLKDELAAPSQSDANIKLFEPVTIQSRERDLIFFVVRGREMDEIADFLGKPLNRLVAEHESVVTASEENMAQEIQRIQQRLGPSDAEKEEEPGAQPTREDRLAELQAQILRHEPTRLIRATDSSAEPIAPKLLLYMFVGSFSGLLLGLFAAASLGRRHVDVVQ